MISGGNSILTVLLMSMLWIWATSEPNDTCDRANCHTTNSNGSHGSSENIFVLIQRENVETGLSHEVEKFSGDPPKYEDLNLKHEFNGVSSCSRNAAEEDYEEPPPNYEEAVTFIVKQQREND